jgi:hypothetical protein
MSEETSNKKQKTEAAMNGNGESYVPKNIMLTGGAGMRSKAFYDPLVE